MRREPARTTLPDPLLLANGKPVRDAKTWNEKRRAEIVRLFEENQYGRSPGRPAAHELRCLRQGNAGARRQSHAPPGHHLLLGRQGGPEDGPPGLRARQRRRACAPAAESEFLRQFHHGRRPGVKAGEVWGRDKKKVPAAAGQELRQGERGAPVWMRASASPRSTTATSIRISWAACPMGCARSI